MHWWRDLPGWVQAVVAVARAVGVVQLIEAVIDLVGAEEPIGIAIVTVLEAVEIGDINAPGYTTEHATTVKPKA